MPAEWEPHESTWLAWPHLRGDWPGKFETIPWVYAEIVRTTNGGLANFETIKRFRVVAEEWSQDTGELTPSMKLKRRVITGRYAAVVDALYEDEATARGE